MIGWLFGKWAERRQVTEAEDFLSRLKAMSPDELGWPLALALEGAQMGRDDRGVDVYRPFEALANDPTLSLYYTRMALELRKLGRTALAPGMIIWTHTLRATVNHRIRPQVREMWRELNRGVPYAEEARLALMDQYQIWPDLTRAGEYPDGMEPKD